MSNHKTYIAGSDGAWQGKCSCKIRSSVFPQRWEAEDWIATHLAAVNRARAHLMTRTPGLKDQRDWYRKQAAATTDEHDREVWLMLAEGLDHRLPAEVEEVPLFEKGKDGRWTV